MPKGVKYGRWSEECMERALAALRNGDMGLNAASRDYDIPKATLKRHLDSKNCYAVENKKILGRLTDLPFEVEKEIVEHVLQMEQCLFGITPKDLRQLAFEVANKNNIPHHFNVSKGLAGKKWYYSFMRRHKELSLRQPEATSFARATGFNKVRVNEFFDVLEKLVDEHKFTATHMFNVDETGLSTVQKKTRKILALKGKHQVGSISSGERGVTTTAVCCASAAGQFVPPMIIFKRARGKDELKDGAPPGTIFAFNPESGYINKDLFLVWLQHFIKTVKPSKNEKVLLLLDGHSTHTKNMEALLLACENGIVMLSLPGHTTHRLQPLDVSFFKPLSSYYISEIEKWLRANPGRCVTSFQVSAIFGKAYGQAAMVATAINGFAHSGVWPVNRNVFQEHHFSASVALQVPAPYIPLPQLPLPQLPLQQEILLAQEIPSTSYDSEEGQIDIPINTATFENNAILCVYSKNQKQRKKSSLAVTVQEISPPPKAVSTLVKRASKGTERTLVLTSSPYKKRLEEAIAKRKPKQPVLATKPKKLKNLEIQNKIVNKCTNKEDWYCSICEQASVEDMIQCLSCKKWVHEDCANVKKGKKIFFCETCI